MPPPLTVESSVAEIATAGASSLLKMLKVPASGLGESSVLQPAV